MTTELVPSPESSDDAQAPEPVRWTLDSMIAALDPDRDYGEYTLPDMAARIRDGIVRISPPYEGTKQPILFDAVTGKRVKGSGVPVPRGTADVRVWARSRFNERAAEDLDSVYDDLILACHSGDPRALKLYFEMFLGQPKPQGGATNDDVFRMMLEKIAQPRETVIEVNAKDVT